MVGEARDEDEEGPQPEAAAGNATLVEQQPAPAQQSRGDGCCRPQSSGARNAG